MGSAYPAFGGYTWTMVDRAKLNTRLDDMLVRRFGPRALEVAARAQALPEDWQEQENGKATAEWRRNKSEILLGRVHPRYRHAVPRHDMTLRWIEAYRAGKRHNLVIASRETGVGKTWEAAALMRVLLTEDYVPVSFIEAPELMDSLRPNADGMSDIGQFQAAPVLIIDDLGAEKASEWTTEQLYRLTNYRAARGLPMVITTNLDAAALEEHCGPRVFRRIADDAGLLKITEAPPEARRTFGAQL